MGFLAMIKTMVSTTVEAQADMRVYNPFVGDCRVVLKKISMNKNLDFGNGGFRRRKTIG